MTFPGSPRQPSSGNERPAGAVTDTGYMERALAAARAAGEQGEVPVGAILVERSGAVLAACGNAPIAAHDATAHAEIRALRKAGRAVGNYRLPGATLYVTLEPCPMCAGALLQARIARLVFGAADPRTGACGSVVDLLRDNRWNHRIEVAGGVLAEECAELLRAFFAARR